MLSIDDVSATIIDGKIWICSNPRESNTLLVLIIILASRLLRIIKISIV